MNRLPSKLIVKRLRALYIPGTRVELIYMNDPYTTLRPGDTGVVVGVDDIGTIFVDWDKGSRLGVAYGEDRVRVIKG